MTQALYVHMNNKKKKKERKKMAREVQARQHFEITYQASPSSFSHQVSGSSLLPASWLS
jgi:hypothetical protein